MRDSADSPAGPGDNVLYVADYAAPGVLDFTAAIVTAVARAAAGTRGMVDVVLPDHPVIVTKEVALQSNIRLQGGPHTVVYDPAYRTSNKHRFFTVTNQTNVVIEQIKVAGNNVDYARATDGFVSQRDSLSNGVGILISGSSNCHIRNVSTQYMWESLVMLRGSDCTMSDVTTDHYNAGNTEHGATLLGCQRSHIYRAHVTNGGDGALYIYNGTDCSIEDSVVENTGTGVFAGCGVESAVNCSLVNVRAKGCWLGFAVVEGNRNCTVTRCWADGCRCGFLVGYFNLGTPGYDVKLLGNKVTNVDPKAGGSMPVAGYVLRPNGNASQANSIQFVNNYFGLSNAGTALLIGDTDKPGPVVLFKELLVQGNTLEANTNYNSTNYSTGLPVVVARKIAGARFTGNVFVNQLADDPVGICRFTACTDVVWSGNVHKPDGQNHICGGLNLDAACARWTIGANEFIQNGTAKSFGIRIAANSVSITGNLFRGNSYALQLTGASKIVATGNVCNVSGRTLVDWSTDTASDCVLLDNHGYDETITRSADFSVSTAWHKHKLVATTALTCTLPAPTVGQEYTFMRTNGDYTITPDRSSRRIGGGRAGRALRLNGTDGDSVTLRCVRANTWDILAIRGASTYV